MFNQNQSFVLQVYINFPLHRRLDSIRRKERNEAHLYFQVEVCVMIINMHIYTSDILQVYIEGHFQAHIGTDLVVMGEAKPICFKVSKSSTLQEFKASLAKQMVCVTLSTILVLIMM